MADQINTTTGDSGSNFGMGLVVGLIIIVAIVLLFVFFFRGGSGGSGPAAPAADVQDVPSEIDVNLDANVPNNP